MLYIIIIKYNLPIYRKSFSLPQTFVVVNIRLALWIKRLVCPFCSKPPGFDTRLQLETTKQH